ncbi:MAG: ABC transporter permease, partial [SAR324 cluster bacterium]|nr:ABC transporter permease [SAR324 cluster bacterium]
MLRNKIERYELLAPILVLILLCVIIGILNHNFFSIRNFTRIANGASIPLILGIGVTFILIMGSIDLSIEGIVAFSAVTLSLIVLNGSNENDFGYLGIVFVLIIGALSGLLNGIIHVYLRIPSFMVTLGVWFIGVGVANAILGGITVRINDKSIRALALERFLDIPLAVWVSLLALLIAYIIQSYTALGKHIYAIGGGEDLVKLSGINVNLCRIYVFTLAGIFFSLGGVIAAAQQGAGFALIGQGRLFTTITAVVVGGTALWGGKGGVIHTLIGVWIVMVLSNG